MDAVDGVFYENVTAEEELIGAYQMFASDDGKKVLADILKYCYWGAQEPTAMDESDAKAILASQRVVWRIKAMLNAGVQENEENQGDDEDE